MNRLNVRCCILVGLLSSSSVALADTCDCDGEPGQRWTNVRDGVKRTGGCVGFNASVSDDSFVAPSAAVCGSAVVSLKARIFDGCIVTGKSIMQSAACYGDAMITGDARVTGKQIRVYQNSMVTGDTVLSGTITVKGNIRLTSGSHSSGTITVNKHATAASTEFTWVN